MHSGGIPFDELKTTQDTKGYMGKWARYCQSKFATVLYTSELAKRHPNIMAVAIHPGVIHTNLVEGLPFLDRVFIKLTTLGKSIPLEKGAYNTLWAATTTDKEALESGGIYEPVGKALKRTEAASDENLWGELWKWTEDQLSAFG
jgi:NAD(P)-dependent dehydrogenase (short-subunit alcohol dehydrogenase family)